MAGSPHQDETEREEQHEGGYDEPGGPKPASPWGRFDGQPPLPVWRGGRPGGVGCPSLGGLPSVRGRRPAGWRVESPGIRLWGGHSQTIPSPSRSVYQSYSASLPRWYGPYPAAFAALQVGNWGSRAEGFVGLGAVDALCVLAGAGVVVAGFEVGLVAEGDADGRSLDADGTSLELAGTPVDVALPQAARMGAQIPSSTADLCCRIAPVPISRPNGLPLQATRLRRCS